ncbi:MAG: glycosyltransferase family 2 protein [Caulobacteraceae bacterium]
MQDVADRPSLTIGVCTFRRDALDQTLASIAGQGQGPIRVVVADNDETPAAEGRIRALGERLGLDLDYRHAPARNISVARNACLDAAGGAWLLFIDDDELAEPGWLAAMSREAAMGRWDVVLGPVDAVYSDAAPQWMRRGDFHSTRPVVRQGRIDTGYSGNALLRLDFVRRHGLRFDPALGRSGGEDLDFFYRLRDAGGLIGFAEDARALEPVPDGRANLGWLLARTFRAGQSHGARLARTKPRAAQRLVQGGIAAGKALVCASGALVSLPRTTLRNRFITRGALHLGVMARVAGLKEIQLY